MIRDNPNRYWFNLYRNPAYASGWVFGDTVDQAFEAAVSEIRLRRRSASGPGTIALQRDVSPAVYFDRKVVL